MLGEQCPSDPNHIALPLQRSLAPRMSAKVRIFGKSSGSFSSAGRTVTASSDESCTDSWPSTLTESCCSPLLGRSLIVDLLETMTERFVRTCGQIGVTTKTPEFGITMGPPADKEYAVEPVEVAMISPSALYSVRCV